MAKNVSANIVLAECSGRAWLIWGEQHIDDLLANTLAADISINVVTCESKSAVDALFRDGGGDDPAMMWLIHPAIVNRARGQGGDLQVHFSPWSAQLDDAALAVLQAAAAQAAQHDEAAVRLVRHLQEGGVAMANDLASLRLSLIEARLQSDGVAPDRIVRETTAASDEAGADIIAVAIRPN